MLDLLLTCALGMFGLRANWVAGIRLWIVVNDFCATYNAGFHDNKSGVLAFFFSFKSFFDPPTQSLLPRGILDAARRSFSAFLSRLGLFLIAVAAERASACPATVAKNRNGRLASKPKQSEFKL